MADVGMAVTDQAPSVIAGGLEPLAADRVGASAAAVARFGKAAGPDPRDAFLTSLNSFQAVPFMFVTDPPDPYLDFGQDGQSARDLIRGIAVLQDLPAGWQWAEAQCEHLSERTNRALELLNSLDPRFRRVVGALVGNLCFGKVPGYQGGSISSLIGSVWIGLDPQREVWEFAELIVHETVHQCLFLEDMVHGVFLLGEDQLESSEFLVTTAILRKRRGFDKALHSAFVAMALSRFHRARGDDSSAERYLRPVTRTYAEMCQRQGCLTAHGQGLLGSIGTALFSDGQHAA